MLILSKLLINFSLIKCNLMKVHVPLGEDQNLGLERLPPALQVQRPCTKAFILVKYTILCIVTTTVLMGVL